MFLTPDEVRELTGRQRRDAQAAALRHMGIEHKVRPDGSIAVLRAHVEREFGGETTQHQDNIEPDWNALR
jgi:hypothetical protein